MKDSVRISAVFALILAPLAGSASTPTLSIVAALPKVGVGCPVDIAVTLVNSDTAPLRVKTPIGHSTQGELIFDVNVTDASGHAVPKTDYGSGLDAAYPVEQGLPRTLKQGDIATDHVILTNVYNMKKPGTYKVQATWGPRSAPIAHSNVITITVGSGPRGDLNGDGVVDLNDVKIVEAALNVSAARDPLTNQESDARDLNGDGVIDGNDVSMVTTLCTYSHCASHP